MRFSRLSLVSLAAFVLLLLVAAAPAGAASMPATYRVLVGAENVRQGADIMAYFPHTLRIHVGDTVRFVQNSNEIHTVTFLGRTALPAFVVQAADLQLPGTPSPLVLNPLAVNRVRASGGLGDTSRFVNSGIMGREPGQHRAFAVTFTARGTYEYVCIVHGMMMSGTVKVVRRGVAVPSPLHVRAIANRQIATKMAMVPAVLAEARSQIKPAVQNGDGTMTHFVAMGFESGQIGLMRFFPKKVTVRSGDTVQWEMTAFNHAPHTVTFLNGETEPALVVPVAQQTGPPVLYMNPDVVFPNLPTPELTLTGLYSSGLLDPIPEKTFSLKVGAIAAGAIPYVCLLHDESGMTGALVVAQ